MNFLKKIDHYLLTNHPVLWRTKVHYFVLFSLILGNVAAVLMNKILELTNPNAFPGFPAFLAAIVFSFATLYWVISQARNKIKYYRFWHEVLTLGVYMCCAASLYINFTVLAQIPIIELKAGTFRIDDAILIGACTYIYIASIVIYLIAHTNFATLLGLIFVHLITLLIVGIGLQTPVVYIILFCTLYMMFSNNPENNRTFKFMRFYLVPFIPLCIFVSTIYAYEADNFRGMGWFWFIQILMITTTIFGSAWILKGNTEPVS